MAVTPLPRRGRRESLKVTVFGATGVIGALVVGDLLADGHAVTAYVRNPAKVPAEWDGRVRVVVGELSDGDAIDTAVAGADAVISALGPMLDSTTNGLPLTEGARLVVAAMQRHGVQRYIGHATPSVMDRRDRHTLVTRLINTMGDWSKNPAFADMRGMTGQVTQTDLDWTIVRFLAPRSTPPSGVLRVGFFGHDSVGFAISRADIAAFTVAQLHDTTYLHAMPAISNARRRERRRAARSTT
jgi:putative NADH-flavin reductase